MISANPDITVSLVNTNNRRLLEPCLESLFAQSTGKYAMEVFLVDNVSTDGSVEMVREKFPTARIICNAKREGFGANHNKVLRIGQGRYFLVLNEDTVILDEAVDKLVAFADQHPEAGIVGPKVLNPDMTLQDSCVYFPTLFRDLKHIFLHRFTKYCPISYPVYIHDTVADVEWLRGPCLLVRREAMEQVGLFDERFFIFHEEVDLCYRMRQHGWRNLFCPDARIIHIGKQTITQGNNQSIAMAAQVVLSQYLYYDKHLGRLSSLSLRLFMLMWLALRLFKTYLPIKRTHAPNQQWHRRLVRHVIWLTTRPPHELIGIGRLPGGVSSS